MREGGWEGGWGGEVGRERGRERRHTYTHGVVVVAVAWPGGLLTNHHTLTRTCHPTDHQCCCAYPPTASQDPAREEAHQGVLERVAVEDVLALKQEEMDQADEDGVEIRNPWDFDDA